MFNTSSSYAPCDLLTNFLTHSFLSLLDNYFWYCKHPSDDGAHQAAMQAAHSFLFIVDHQHHALTTLNHTLFAYYPQTFTISRRLKLQTLSRLRRNYSRTLLKTPADSLHQLNQDFVASYYQTIFSYYQSEKDMPLLFQLHTAVDIVNEVHHLLELPHTKDA